jgi:hypothetical protein
MSTRTPGLFADSPGARTCTACFLRCETSMELVISFSQMLATGGLGPCHRAASIAAQILQLAQGDCAAPPVAMTLTDVRSPDMRSSLRRRSPLPDLILKDLGSAASMEPTYQL